MSIYGVKGWTPPGKILVASKLKPLHLFTIQRNDRLVQIEIDLQMKMKK